MLKDFKENEKRTEKVLVLGVEEKKTARGSAFIVCSVTDGETKLEVKFWNTTKLMFEMFIHKVVSILCLFDSLFICFCIKVDESIFRDHNSFHHNLLLSN